MKILPGERLVWVDNFHERVLNYVYQKKFIALFRTMLLVVEF